MSSRPKRMWSAKDVSAAKSILSKSTTLKHAVISFSKEHGPISYDAMRSAFARFGELSPQNFLSKEKTKVLEPGEHLKKLYLLAKHPTKFSVLCDKMDMSPSKVKNLIEEAWNFGMALRVTMDHVGIEPQIDDDRVKDIIAPTVGKRHNIGVISDTHLGSKYCMRAQLVDFIKYVYSRGVRIILHPGDVVDGDYRHAKFEMSHVGLEAQTEDLYETLPKLPGLTYHCITGNHDHTFTAESGVNVGKYITNYFASRGRKDIAFHGERSAFLRVHGVVVHLWHPRSGGAYALSYPLMKKIESYSVTKPQVLLAGHWHRHVTCYERSIHAIACPTFQAPGSEFSKSLASAPAIGGLILSWDITEHGTMRSFVIEKRSYFEREQIVVPYNTTDAIDVGQT